MNIAAPVRMLGPWRRRSDVRRVGYWLVGLGTPVSSFTPEASSTLAGAGLVRYERDLATAQYASQQGEASLEDASVIAPEVLTLEFLYCDGTQWLTSWDTTSNSGLPQAVKISVAMADASRRTSTAGGTSQFASIAEALAQDPESVYSVVVRMPACDPIPSTQQSGQSSSSSGSTTESGASGGQTTGS